MNDSILRLLPDRTARWVLLITSVALAAAASAHAGAPSADAAVFPTIEAAAAAALRHASAVQGEARREFGGAIVRVPGGFAYTAPRAGDEEGVRVKLGSDDVAWYYTHGARGPAALDRLNERVSRRDREMVDRVDPRHRPLFVSTPSGRLLRYGDGQLAEITLDAPLLAQERVN
jgi:hypothetical protein